MKLELLPHQVSLLRRAVESMDQAIRGDLNYKTLSPGGEQAFHFTLEQLAELKALLGPIEVYRDLRVAT